MICIRVNTHNVFFSARKTLFRLPTISTAKGCYCRLLISTGYASRGVRTRKPSSGMRCHRKEVERILIESGQLASDAHEFFICGYVSCDVLFPEIVSRRNITKYIM